jgi:predicted O-methyltransferase YrrM
MSEPTCLTAEKVGFGNLEIFFLESDDENEHCPHEDTLFMIKNLYYVEGYQRIKLHLRDSSASNILEIGIFRGGSAPFFHRFFDAQRMVCIDLATDPAIPLENYRRRWAPGVIRTYYGVDQADRTKVTTILEEEFSSPIDLVIDDASHCYEETKTTFEIVFPYLRPGGIYVIEDWGWAHAPEGQLPDHFLADRFALTNLVFELIMIYGSESNVIQNIEFSPGMMWIKKGSAQVPIRTFRVENYAPKRGRTLNLI